MPPRRGLMPDSIEETKLKTQKGREQVHNIPGVVTTGITHSDVTGISPETPSHQILVYIKDSQTIKNLPKDINGVKVVYTYSSKLRPLYLNKNLTYNTIKSLDSNQYRPIKIGSEISNNAHVPSTGGCWVGTLGGFPYLSDGSQVILSNNHVIAFDYPNTNTAVVGQPIYQPGCITTSIGTLEKWIPITPSGNLVDAAYALINSSVQLDDITLCNYRISNSISPVLNLPITKTGRTSGCTYGYIEAVDILTTVDYSDDPNVQAPATFTHQFSTSPSFCQAGDSGSVIVTNDSNRNAVGLLYAGDDYGRTFASPMSFVEQQLGVTFKPALQPPPTPTPLPTPYTCEVSIPGLPCMSKTTAVLIGVGVLALIILR